MAQPAGSAAVTALEQVFHRAAAAVTADGDFSAERREGLALAFGVAKSRIFSFVRERCAGVDEDVEPLDRDLAREVLELGAKLQRVEEEVKAARKRHRSAIPAAVGAALEARLQALEDENDPEAAAHAGSATAVGDATGLISEAIGGSKRSRRTSPAPPAPSISELMHIARDAALDIAGSVAAQRAPVEQAIRDTADAIVAEKKPPPRGNPAAAAEVLAAERRRSGGGGAKGGGARTKGR